MTVSLAQIVQTLLGNPVDLANVRSVTTPDVRYGSRGVLVRRRRTPGLISSLRGTAGLPPFISFSTSYPELSKDLLMSSFEPRRRDSQVWRRRLATSTS